MSQSNDASRKSPRTFQCREQLWDTFELMARELECSIDYLLNEAMKQYARQRSYGPSTAPPIGTPAAARTPLPPAREVGASEDQRATIPSTRPTPPISRPGGTPLPSTIPGRLPPPPPGVSRAAPPPPPSSRTSTTPTPPPPTVRGPTSGPPPLPRPPASSSAQAATIAASPSQRSTPSSPSPQTALTAVYMGERTPVDKEKFIIGRGRRTSDLTIKDPNVSRQHAMIEFQNGTFYMVDLGSTNGVEYQGQRVTRRTIAEGDVFRICDHEVAFTFR